MKHDIDYPETELEWLKINKGAAEIYVDKKTRKKKLE